MSHPLKAVQASLQKARAEGIHVVVEPEGFSVLRALGFRTPRQVFVEFRRDPTPDELATLTTQAVVVKVISPDVLHRSDVGGVRFVENEDASIASALEDLRRRFGKEPPRGFTITERVPYDAAFGNELLLGVRWTDEFGPVLVIGAGGVNAEFLSARFRDGRDTAVFAAGLPLDPGCEDRLRRAVVVELASQERRGQPPGLLLQDLLRVLERLRDMAETLMPDPIVDFEINPLVVYEGDLWALDVLIKLRDPAAPRPPERPLHKLEHLLHPRSIAISGVSKRMNPGHVVLTNLLRDGFDPEHIFVVKPDTESIAGCACYPTVSALPRRVDLIVLALDASQIPLCITEIIERQAAESIIVLSGGLEEKAGSENLVRNMNATLSASRKTAWQGPLINGGNSLGIESRPGGYNTIFIPSAKLGLEPRRGEHLALISQSGAFAIARQNKLRFVRPRYTISVGNQMDVTIGDYLSYLRDDREVHTFAVYVEGFRPFDGLRFLQAARDIIAEGRTVILYRAGRTQAGARATSSHTASIAGDYAVTRSLADDAGILVAGTIEEFEDLTMLSCFLHEKRVAGWRLGALSNAGFECVAVADNIGRFTLDPFLPATSKRIAELLVEARVDRVVDVHNPLDVTPMAGEPCYEATFRAILEDDTIDVGLLGCVPLTPALATLSADGSHGEDVGSDDALPARVARVVGSSDKAVVAVVDGGSLYDPMVSALLRRGVPTFRSVDRATKCFARYCAARLAHPHK